MKTSCAVSPSTYSQTEQLTIKAEDVRLMQRESIIADPADTGGREAKQIKFKSGQRICAEKEPCWKPAWLGTLRA